MYTKFNTIHSMKDVHKSELARKMFFDRQVKMEVWKDNMSGKNEKKVVNLFELLDYKENVDFFRQYPIGEKFVIDFAFVNEKVAIEADGDSHNSKKQRRLDKARDWFLRANNWVCVRVSDSELFGYKGSFYKSLIKEVVEERREQYNSGRLYEIEIPKYKSENYE